MSIWQPELEETDYILLLGLQRNHLLALSAKVPSDVLRMYVGRMADLRTLPHQRGLECV